MAETVDKHFKGWKRFDGPVARPGHDPSDEKCPLHGVPADARGEIGIFGKVFWLDWSKCNCGDLR